MCVFYASVQMPSTHTPCSTLDEHSQNLTALQTSILECLHGPWYLTVRAYRHALRKVILTHAVVVDGRDKCCRAEESRHGGSAQSLLILRHLLTGNPQHVRAAVLEDRAGSSGSLANGSGEVRLDYMVDIQDVRSANIICV